MTKRKRDKPRQRREERRFRVHGVRRDPPDLHKLGKAVLSLAQAEAERQAQLEHQAQQRQEHDELVDDKGARDA